MLAIPRPEVADRPFDIVFLDRDGTINTCVSRYVSTPIQLEVLPGAAEAIAALNRSGTRVVVVTNQRGLATGELTVEQLGDVHAALGRRLARAGAQLDAILVCPHEENTCRCRKPGPGLFEQALTAAPWADPARCVMVGDMVTDVVPAASFGMRPILLGVQSTDTVWERAEDLADAVDRLLGAGSLIQEESS